ncbi:cytochrome d ubiquinol oxidase subunit II [Ferviditalea candida]|uniref:Cytochrome d ubiquinol oxidase subunit II n=1 Tax=Ferviditalea candida TaxID=3108399 RepID=A0ABU5ZFP0_9BACL|nr:cytochrome d ubiquinol oxidase subunit II [Paenibacillaceae bacterium T2]
MAHETLAIIWFGLWGLIWAVYFMLDGYSLGTGMLFPFITKNEREERQLQEAIGPFWGSNEVWLITAGGATFAAFPLTYALMFSYLYTPLFLVLFGLFYRAAGLEFMHKHSTARWRAFWKGSFFAGSLVIALIFGIAFANIFRGLPVDETGYHGNLLTLLNPYGLLGGVLFLSLFLLSGSLWTAFKTDGAVRQRAIGLGKGLWLVSVAVVAMFDVATANQTPIFDNYTEHPALWLIPALSIGAVIAVGPLLRSERLGAAFAAVSLGIIGIMATGFIGLFPNMLPSRLDPAFSVTLFDAAASELNLKIMFFIALVAVPVVIAYQIWIYRIFKDKITSKNAQGYH